MNCSVLICTFGGSEWAELANERAWPSAAGQGALEVIAVYERDASLAQVRNQAASKAKGDWLAFLDADDEFAPGYLDAMRAALEKWTHGPLASPRPLLLAPAVQYVRTVPTVTGTTTVEERPRVLNDGRPLHDVNRAVIGTLVPRELFLAVGGFRDLPALEDWDIWLRCERAGAALVDVPGAVYRAHVRPGSRNADQSLYWEIRAEHEAALAGRER